jgi:hypothetical protein
MGADPGEAGLAEVWWRQGDDKALLSASGRLGSKHRLLRRIWSG